MMKYFVAIALLGCLCVVSANNGNKPHPKRQTTTYQTQSTQSTLDHCHNSLQAFCDAQDQIQIPFSQGTCDAIYGGFTGIESKVQDYLHLQLEKSYEYLLMASHFNSYQIDRPGFHKLYKDLSDRSFDDTIELMKQITRRGGNANFARYEREVQKENPEVEVSELASLGLALDTEKQLANGAFLVHAYSTHKSRNNHEHDHDPEMAHFIEEKFMGKQASTVRKLSGYVNDLSKMMDSSDPALSIYLFDEYLQKQ